MNSNKYLFILIGLLIHVICIAGSPDSLLEKGNSFLEKKQYQDALENYQSILKSGFESEHLFKNIALANAELNEHAKAILYYEKALKFAPNNNHLLSNLKIIKNRISEYPEALPEFFIFGYVRKVAGIFGPLNWTILSFSFLIILGIYLLKFLPKLGLNRKKLIISSSIFLIFILCTAFAYYRNQQVFYSNAMIIMQQNTSLKVGPDETSPDVMPLVPGSKVYIDDKLGSWIKVKTINADVGWILSISGEII